MKRVLGTRGIGKSIHLMEYACANDIHYILCINPQNSLISANTKGYEGITFLRYNDSFVNDLIKQNVPFLVDDLECFLSNRFPNLKGYTQSLD